MECTYCEGKGQAINNDGNLILCPFCRGTGIPIGKHKMTIKELCEIAYALGKENYLVGIDDGDGLRFLGEKFERLVWNDRDKIIWL